jgi:hypothetical protein
MSTKSTYWKVVPRNDPRARELADRHYSRKVIGAAEFCPPGHNIVLLGLNDDALWVSHRPAPDAGLERPRFDGFDCWDNPYFRKEGEGLASDMILEALAITMWYWGDVLPCDGFHTFVNPEFVKPVMKRGKPIYGYCYDRAQFGLYSELSGRGLWRWIYSMDQLRRMKGIKPQCEQMDIWALMAA